MANAFDIYYRVHVRGQGWLNAVKNGAETGSSGLCKRIEALEVQMVPKGAQPNFTDNGGSTIATGQSVLTDVSYTNCESSSSSTAKPDTPVPSCTNQTCYYTTTCYKYWGGTCGNVCTGSYNGRQVNTSYCDAATSCCCKIPYSCQKTYTCCK